MAGSLRWVLPPMVRQEMLLMLILYGLSAF